MSNELVVTQKLKEGIKRHTLSNAVGVESTKYAQAVKDHFKRLGRVRLHLLDCSEIRCVASEVYEAIVVVHKRMVKHGHKLVISAGNNAMRYHQYRNVFCSDGVGVYLTEESAVRELLR